MKYKTEKAFENKYYNFFEEGIYIDKISKEVLFLSLDKKKTDTGWPSFSKSINEKEITKTEELINGIIPTIEVSSSGNHIGHIFKDGSTETNEIYCVNSYALEFIPKSQMNDKYKEYLKYFK